MTENEREETGWREADQDRGKEAHRSVEDKSNRAVGADIYEALVDSLDLVVKCENDWYSQNERINLLISDRWGGGSIVMCFDPDTLERDIEAEDKLRKELKERD